MLYIINAYELITFQLKLMNMEIINNSTATCFITSTFKILLKKYSANKHRNAKANTIDKTTKVKL